MHQVKEINFLRPLWSYTTYLLNLPCGAGTIQHSPDWWNLWLLIPGLPCSEQRVGVFVSYLAGNFTILSHFCRVQYQCIFKTIDPVKGYLSQTNVAHSSVLMFSPRSRTPAPSASQSKTSNKTGTPREASTSTITVSRAWNWDQFY